MLCWALLLQHPGLFTTMPSTSACSWNWLEASTAAEFCYIPSNKHWEIILAPFLIVLFTSQDHHLNFSIPRIMMYNISGLEFILMGISVGICYFQFTEIHAFFNTHWSDSRKSTLFSLYIGSTIKDNYCICQWFSLFYQQSYAATTRIVSKFQILLWIS